MKVYRIRIGNTDKFMGNNWLSIQDDMETTVNLKGRKNGKLFKRKYDADNYLMNMKYNIDYWRQRLYQGVKEYKQLVNDLDNLYQRLSIVEYNLPN